MKKSLRIGLSVAIGLVIVLLAAPLILGFMYGVYLGFTEGDKPANYFNERALELAGEGDYENALKEIDKALEKYPESSILYQNRGRIYEKLGNHEEASKNYAQAAMINPAGPVGALAYHRLKTMAETLEQKNKESALSESGAIFSEGIKFIDSAVERYNGNNLEDAREHLRLAIALLSTALTVDPEDKKTLGFLYMAKGFMYHVIGRQYAGNIKSNDNAYTAMEWLRRAYPPFLYADRYYEYAKNYLTSPAQKELIEGYIKTNDYYVKNAKKYIPTVDFEGRVFIKNMDIESKCIVNLDILNTMVNMGNYSSAFDFATENLDLLKKVNTNEALNSVGLSYLFRSYQYLIHALNGMDKGSEWIKKNKPSIEANIDNCLNDLETAQRYTLNDSLAEFSANTVHLAQSIKKRLNNTGE